MKKKICIVPDIPGWAVENMALNIIKSLNDKFDFTLRYADKISLNYGKKLINWNKIDNYDVVYIMLPSYIPQGLSDYSKIITTFHGGPGTEGQANMIENNRLQNMRISYVSNQTMKRVKSKWSSIDRINIPKGIKNHKKWLLETGRFKKEDKIQVFEFEKNLYRVKFTKNGFGLNNLYYTPHGVDTEMFNQDIINSDFSCGYAGWVKYLLGNQKDHRRSYWIINAWNKNKFKLYIAGGIKINNSKINNDINYIKTKYKNKIFINLYNHNEMPKFYKNISCYLVPDKFAGGPMPVLEAGAMGIPVITTNAGLCGDIIKNNINGILIKNYDDFEKAILYMKNHHKERKEIGINLQKYIRKNRTWNAVSHYWEKFLNI